MARTGTEQNILCVDEEQRGRDDVILHLAGQWPGPVEAELVDVVEILDVEHVAPPVPLAGEVTALVHEELGRVDDVAGHQFADRRDQQVQRGQPGKQERDKRVRVDCSLLVFFWTHDLHDRLDAMVEWRVNDMVGWPTRLSRCRAVRGFFTHLGV